MSGNLRKQIKKVAWGLFWLLIAGLVLANYFGFFGEDFEFGIWHIIFGTIALMILFHCLATLAFANIPIPLAALYFILQGQIEALPEIDFWPLAAVAILLTIAFHFLLPRRFKYGNFVNININNGERVYAKKFSASSGESYVIGNSDENGDDENNPSISVSFGGAVRYLHADCLKTAELTSSFGSLEVYFDNVTLHPDGAEVNVNCSFGNLEIYVPAHWRVIDDINASLANAEVSRKLRGNDPDAPTLRITGSVSLGNVEVSRIKD